jgi:hypothetical protein
VDDVRYDPVWRRIRRDHYADKLEGRFGERSRRLEHLANWGALSWIYPHATTTKYAHHLGVEHNASRYLGADDSRLAHRAAFRTAAHVLHWGHLPLSYQGAEALLRAGHVEPQVQLLLQTIIDEVALFGSLACTEPGHSGRCVEAMVAGERPFELYRWLAAWLVAQDWKRLWQAIRDAESASGGEKPDEDQTKSALTRALVCRDDLGYQVLSACNQADYVPRDLLQCGTAWLSLDPDVLWETNPTGPDAAREWDLIEAAREYLEDRFYATPQALLAHTLAARIIANALSGGGLDTANLKELLDSPNGDQAWISRLSSYHGSRLAALQTGARVGTFDTEWLHVGTYTRVSLPDGTRLAAEDYLTERSGRERISYPLTKGYCSFVEWNESRDGPDLAGAGRRYGDVWCFGRKPGENQKAFPLITLLTRIYDWSSRPTADRVVDSALSWLLGKTLQQRAKMLELTCGELILADSAFFRNRMEALSEKVSLAELKENTELAVLIDRFPLPPFSGRPRLLGDFFLRLPWRVLRMADGEAALHRLRDDAVAMASTGEKVRRGHALEVAVAADQLGSSDECAYRLLAVNTTELTAERSPVAEWDVIRLDLLKSGDWTITVVECAIKRSASKDEEARVKFDALQGALRAGYSDFQQYTTLLTTVEDGALVYEDGGRGWSRTPT